ncbi:MULTISPECIES: hypothetical protein [unclassified Streptomyces]|uniref:hypothetical protein n=1 Tax=unclassified Streptomyces TaxID=2593676 RepID=UPI00381B8CB7
MTTTFVDGYDDRDSAYASAFRPARILVRARLSDRYGMSVHRMKGGWGVYLTDRTPDRPAPATLRLLPFRSTPHRAAA